MQKSLLDTIIKVVVVVVACLPTAVEDNKPAIILPEEGRIKDWIRETGEIEPRFFFILLMYLPDNTRDG